MSVPTPVLPPPTQGIPGTALPPGAPKAASAPGTGRGLGPGHRLVGVAGLFVAVLALGMVVAQWRQPLEEPWRSPALNAARERLAADPKNEALKTEVRQLDQRLRQHYFRGLERNRLGAWLLLGAGILLVTVSRGLGSSHRARPVDGRKPELDRHEALARSQVTVLVVGGAGLAGFLALGLLSPTRLPEELARSLAAASSAAPGRAGTHGTAAGPGSVAPVAWPGPDQLARQWPRFHGHAGQGAALEAALPLDWDVASGRGVLWKAPVPLAGYNSPVVWGDRVFLTGGDKKARLVFCFDLGSGSLLWQRPLVPTNAAVPAIDPPDQSGAAASSVATDGQRVYAVFASGELGALDFAGNLAWHQKLDFSENGYGHASSLVVWQDRLLVQADQGQAEDGKSVLHALDTRTGKALWAARRPVGGSWTTPVVVEVAGQAQVITAGDPWLMSHEAATGAEIWRAKVLGGELAPSPVPAGGLVIATSPGHALSAVKTDGKGDVTESHVAWKLESDVPDVPTPAVSGEVFVTASTEGYVFCREIATGKVVWEHRFEAEIQASPLIAGGRIYLISQPGQVLVLDAGREFRQLAAFGMGEEVYASPAVAGGRLLVRTKSNLLCIGAPAGAPVAAATPPDDHGR